MGIVGERRRQRVRREELKGKNDERGEESGSFRLPASAALVEGREKEREREEMAQRFSIQNTREWCATETGAPDPPAAAAHSPLSRQDSSLRGSASASARGKWASRCWFLT